MGISKINTPSLFALLLITSVAAPCTAFWPQDSSVRFDNSIKWFTSYERETNTQSLAVEMDFRGDASSFGITFATPSEPEVYETDENLFQQLRDITPRTPDRMFRGFGGLASSADQMEQSGVEVVEQKDVGDFRASVLRANSSSALTSWLEDNNYSYDEDNVNAFQHYVEKPGFHFIALKINYDEVECLQDKNRRELTSLATRGGPSVNAQEAAIIEERTGFEFESRGRDFERNLSEIDTSSCYVRGTLKPFAVNYTTETPMLYTRIMGQNAKQLMEIDLYTAGDVPWYVPGTTVHYSDRVDGKDLEESPAAEQFVERGDYLTRATMEMNFTPVDRDIELRPGTEELEIERGDQERVVNPQLVREGTGVVPENGVRRLRFEQPEEASPDWIERTIFLLKDSSTFLGKFAAGTAGGVMASVLLVPGAFIGLPLLLVEIPGLAGLLLMPAVLGASIKRREDYIGAFLGTAIGTIALVGYLTFTEGGQAVYDIAVLTSLGITISGASYLLGWATGKLTKRLRAVREHLERESSLKRSALAGFLATLATAAAASVYSDISIYSSELLAVTFTSSLIYSGTFLGFRALENHLGQGEKSPKLEVEYE